MTNIKVKKNKNRLQKHFSPFTIFLFVALLIFVFTIIFAIYWTIVTSLKINEGVFMFDKFGVPKYGYYKKLKDIFSGDDAYSASYLVEQAEKEGALLFYGIRNVFSNFFIKVGTDKVLLGRMYINSLIYAMGCAIASTVVPCVTAYVCAKFDFRFCKWIVSTVIIVMAVPIIGSLPAEITMTQKLGMYGTFWGVWIMKANFLGIYFLVMYASLKSIPMTFTEAAKIDGASNMAIMLKIVLPLAKNTIFTIFLIKFVEFWNDYQTPLIYMSGYPTVSFGLNYNMVYGDANMKDITAIMSIVILTCLPVTVIFMFFQNKLLSNLTMGGVKG